LDRTSLIGTIAMLSVKEMKIRSLGVWKAVILGTAASAKGISNAATKSISEGSTRGDRPPQALAFVRQR
jgi:hypothetical protein